MTTEYQKYIRKLLHLGDFELEKIEEAYWWSDLDSKLEMLEIVKGKANACKN
jgi:hypothetical protein